MKVAILGCAPSARMAPFYDDSFQIWGTGTTGQRYPRFDRWFQIHDMDKLTRGYRKLTTEQMTELMDWHSKFKGPVYMQKVAPGIPGSVVYPFDEMIEKFGRNFRATASWMLALAITEILASGDEEKEIGIYGVDMASEGEYQEQRPSVRFFEGWARGAGIKVTVTASSSLSKCRFLYGLEDEAEAALQEYEDICSVRHQKAAQAQAAAEREASELSGALSVLKLIREDRL